MKIGVANPKIWTTKDGREIPIKEMTDGHLLNAIAYLRRKAGIVKARELAVYLCGPEPRGDGAMDAFDAEFQDAEEKSAEDHLAGAIPAYSEMITEAERRGLEVPEFDEEAAEQRCDSICVRLFVSEAEEESQS